MDKINVYVPENVGMMIENDATMFEVYKKDGKTINKNRFLGMLISGYYGDYAAEAKNVYEAIYEAIDTDRLSAEEKGHISEIILKEIFLPKVPSRKGKNPSRLSLKPTKDTEALVEQIMRDLGGEDYISQYFCRMIMSYCNKTFSQRERILFKDNYETLRLACDAHQNINIRTIWNDKKIHEVIPYKLVTGPEEMFNYLLCAEVNPITNEQEAKAYRLNRIDRINYSHSLNLLDDSAKYYLELMLQYGPQYMINDEEETCVRLTSAGLKSFNRIYYGRPRVCRMEEKESYTYLYFKCSKDQIFLYFRRFSGTEAVIMTPEWLRKKMLQFHKESIGAYHEEE